MSCRCENCGKEHDGRYGSGRFCSKSCSRSFNAKLGYQTKKKNGTFISNLHPEQKRSEYGRWKCTICGEIFQTRQSMQYHRKSTHEVKRGCGWSWNKGLTAETSEIIRNIAEKNKISMKGISHKQSKETKEKLSEIRSLTLDKNNGGFQDVGWYRVNNINGVEFTVRGTWELTIAELLNKHKILWIRNQCLKYTKDGLIKTYNPDFYLPISNEYIEVKGYYSDNDKLKMKLVLEQNKNVRIYMIGQDVFQKFKNEELWLNEDLVMKTIDK